MSNSQPLTMLDDPLERPRPISIAQRLLAGLHLDGPLLAGLTVLCGLGLVVLYSASGQSTELLFKQIVRLGVAAAGAGTSPVGRRLTWRLAVLLTCVEAEAGAAPGAAPVVAAGAMPTGGSGDAPPELVSGASAPRGDGWLLAELPRLALPALPGGGGDGCGGCTRLRRMISCW